jgi:Ca2+-transporting ATPase
LFVDQFKTTPVALLSVAAGISLFTGGVADAAVIMGVVLINAVIGYSTETQSDRIIQSLKQRASPSAWVIRDRQLSELNGAAIVPGDILVLRPGTYVAADARVIEAKHLSVDESVLTGESLPVTKSPVPLKLAEIPLGDRANMVYGGTLITGGQGLAVVVATADATEMGKIQALVGEAAPPETPMERQLNQAGSQLVWLSSTVCGVVFGIGLLRGYGLLEMMKTSIALAVAAVPEGLPAVATTTLALGIRNMRKQKVLIRQLDAVETLGSLQSLCLDKTGTLTANKMSVVEIHTDNTPLPVGTGSLAFDNRFTSDTQETLQKLLHVIVLCNESDCDDSTEVPNLKGSATENALLDIAIRFGVNVNQLRADWSLVGIRHRSETHNVMQTLHSDGSEKFFVAVKGNPSEVLNLCNWHLAANHVVLLTPNQRTAIDTENERMAGNGLRILGVAYGHTSDPTLETYDNLVWLGLVGMADPIRPGVKDMIEVFHRAGIETIMITGDQSPTAYAIGKELNLSQGEQLQILDSTDLAKLDREVVSGLCDRIHVFSRISPANKLQVVQALQRDGKVVAMTGDGINDAPALKVAEVGIAMGHTGTDVAREVADVVLEDDDLGTMAIAVSQGRTIYNNIRKSLHFLLSTNLSEIIVMLAATSLGLGQPLNAMQLLWLNLVTDIFPGLALALEPPEPDVLMHPPRDPQEPIIQRTDFWRIGVESSVLSASALTAYGYALSRYGVGAQSSTIGFMSLTLAQLLHALSCRSKGRCVWTPQRLPPNRYLAIALSSSIALQLLSALVPGLRQLLHIALPNLTDIAVIGSSALVPLVINEASKRKAGG